MNTRRINLTQLNKLLLALLLISIILYFGRVFIIPVAIAVFLAMLLFPVTQKLERLKVRKSIAALFSILILLTFLGFLGTLVYLQVQELKSDLPQLEERIEKKTESLQWIFYKETGVPEKEQEELIEEKKPDILIWIGKFLKNFLVKGLYIVLMFFVILAYTFLFLISRHRIKNFLIKLNYFDSYDEAKIILLRISDIVHNYLKGVFIVISVMAVIYFMGFWILGIKHALLFAIITALLRIIPYIGSFVGIGFPIAFTFLTKDPLWYPLLVLGFFMITQLVEAYLLTPNITGSKVKLNPLVTIMAILLGHFIWGLPGMVLFVPLFGILKVIFDQIPTLNPYGYILGKEENET